MPPQSELEHRKPKSRTVRTSQRMIEMQLARAERRQYRISRIRRRLYPTKKVDDDEKGPMDPRTHHYIGKTQNDFIDIGQFIFQNTRDPAIKASQALFLHFAMM